MTEDERRAGIMHMMTAPPLTEVRYNRVVKTDPLKLGSVKLDNGQWAHPLASGSKSPQVGDQVMSIMNVVQGRLQWIGFTDSAGIAW